MKTVLVTGGCGFIGSHFIRHLHETTDFAIVNVDAMTYAGDDFLIRHLAGDDRYSFVKGNVADRGLINSVFESFSPYLVINFAAESHVDRSIIDASPFTLSNVVGTQTLLDAAVKFGVERFLQISTDEVYGDRSGLPAADESAALHAGSPYSASKAAADLFAESYRRTHGLDVVIARCTNNYGARQFPEKIIPLVIRNAMKGDELPIYGDGLQTRDWLFVADNVRGLLAALTENHRAEVINFGSGKLMTNLELVRSICNVLAERTGEDPERYSTLIRHVEDRPGHDRVYSVTTELASRVLGWEPGTDIESGLANTIDWYVSNPEWVDSVTGTKSDTFYDQVHSRNSNPGG